MVVGIASYRAIHSIEGPGHLLCWSPSLTTAAGCCLASLNIVSKLTSVLVISRGRMLASLLDMSRNRGCRKQTRKLNRRVSLFFSHIVKDRR